MTAPGLLRQHVLVIALFVVLGVGLTWPLVFQLTTHVPGANADDNVVFIWNQWWMRRALSSEASFFFTDFLFVPTGASIVLHTHTAFNALIGATVLGRLSPSAALNVTLILNCVLSGFFAYLLAYHVSRAATAAVIAGIGFAFSATLSGALGGPFNYHTAWGLPLFALLLMRALEKEKVGRLVAAGAALGLLVYLDYYYTVYSILLLALFLVQRRLQPSVAFRLRRPMTGRLDLLILIVAVAAGVTAAMVTAYGGLTIAIGPLSGTISRGINLRALAAAGCVVLIWRSVSPRFSVSPLPLSWATDAKVVLVIAGTSLLVAWPVLYAALSLWQAGDYVSQRYLWRSVPVGIDLLGPVLGNPYNTFWAPIIRPVYRYFDISLDGPGWLGASGLIVLACWRSVRGHPQSFLWIGTIVFFGVWSFGPWLTVLAVNTGLPLPQTLARYLPIAANARLPAQAMIMVHLGLAVLLSIVLARHRVSGSRLAMAAVAGVVLLDCSSVPIPTYQLDRPEIYERLLQESDGALLELPLGVRDGFGGRGFIDPAIMYYQTIHQKPIIGGYISRLPTSVQSTYLTSPVLSSLLAAAEGHAAPGVDALPDPTAELRALGVRYVVVDWARMNPETKHLLDRFQLHPLAGGTKRQLFRLGG